MVSTTNIYIIIICKLQGMVAHTGILAIPEVEMRRITVLFYIA
jgi:hypothetical protein